MWSGGVSPADFHVLLDFNTRSEHSQRSKTTDVLRRFPQTVAIMELVSKTGGSQGACGNKDQKNEQPVLAGGDAHSISLTEKSGPRAFSRPAAGFSASSDTVAASSLLGISREQPGQSVSSAERSRAARFNAVVNVVYYDSKKSHTARTFEGQDSVGTAVSPKQASREAEYSVYDSSDDGDEHVPHGSHPFLAQTHTAYDGDLLKLGGTSSDLELKEKRVREAPEPWGNPSNGFLPKWARINVAYVTAINRDSSFEAHGPYHILHSRFQSWRRLMFKREKIETEFADFNMRRMSSQVAIGTFFLAFIFTVHFVTLRNNIVDMTGLVIGEFVVSLLLLFAMVIICFSYCFRRILELAITITIGMLFSFRAAVRVAVIAMSINMTRLGTLGLFAYSLMGFAEALLLFIIPYQLASIRYAFCFWLTFVVVLWVCPVVGLSAKLTLDMYRETEEGYWFWSPVVYAAIAGLALALDQSCWMHERKRRMVFWKLKTADDRLELLEDQVFPKTKRKPTYVPGTPLETAINHLDNIQAMLCSSKPLDKEREHLQDLLYEARRNLTVSDNIYQFNAEACSDEFARSYVYDLRREGISKPRKLSRQTSLAVRRKSRTSSAVDPFALKANISKVGVDWSFDCIAFGCISKKPIYDVGYTILSPFCLSPDVSLSREVLCNFLDELSNQYLDNPYHNALHGATVCHMTLCLLEMLSVREFMNDLEDISAGIASLCHDVGHPGRNNNFMIAASTPLAITYNDGSVLENHHASLTFRILGKPQCNILEKVAPGAYRIIRKCVIEWILATDMKMHFDHISSFRTRRMNGEFSLATNEEDRSRIISMCIKAADLGHAATVWEQHEEWCRRVVREFYEQGDEEERLGLPKSFLCDRSHHDKEFLPSQIGFITFVVKVCVLMQPLYDELKAVDDMLQLSKQQEVERVCIANLDANVAHWQWKEKGLSE